MSTEKDLINGTPRKKKYDPTEELEEVKRKRVIDSGEAYTSTTGIPVLAVLPPSEASVCKCSHQCNKLTYEDILAIFNAYHEKTYKEQSQYIVHHCMQLTEPQRRRTDKETSRKQVTFHYKLQLGPKKVNVCQKMLCHVLGVTPKRIRVLQNKMKNNEPVIDFSDKRGKHNNRPHKVSEETMQKIRDHIKSIKNPHASEMQITEMHQVFSEQNPQITVSRMIYTNLWRQSNSCAGEADSLEDFDDPVNERLTPQDIISVETIKCEPETVRDSLNSDGQLCRIKAEMRTEVMKLLDGSDKSNKVKQPKSPHDVLLLNELIREYFDWIGYKYTSNVLVAECELGKQPLDRSFLAQDLGVKETEKSQSLPLLFCLIETFKELKAASMKPC